MHKVSRSYRQESCGHAGVKATFHAAGQIEIMISGAGVLIDAVVPDFVAGAQTTRSRR
jgi:uncharacterized NAD-dependent epimerase/dehydratase family protein